MNSIKQSKLCGIISCLILVSTIMSFAYSLSRRTNNIELPYGLSNNYMKFVNTENINIKFNDIINIQKDDKITIISEYAGENFIALYDPSFYFYDQKMVHALGGTRYFSNKDYVNKTKTGILVSDIDLFKGFTDMKNVNTPLIDEFIFHINSYSCLFRNDINFIINQTCIENLGNIIYLDCHDLNNIEIIKKELLLAGYKIEEKIHISINEVCKNLLNGSIYELVLLISSLSLYPIFLFTCIMFFYNNKRILYIHKLYGGINIRILFNLSRQFLFINICFSALVELIYYLLLKNDILRYFKIIDFIAVFVIHILITSFSFLIGFYINIKVVDLKVGENYVK